MSYYQVTVQPNGMFAANDFLGLEAIAPEAQFTVAQGTLGNSFSFIVTGGVFDRIRPYLRRLSIARIPQTDASGNPVAGGLTWPLMTYQVTMVPGSRPKLIASHPGTLSAGGAGSQTLALTGVGLIAGTAAQYIFLSQPLYPSSGSFSPETAVPVSVPPVPVLTITAVRKGPAGNLIGLNILPAAASGSVATVFGLDGAITVNVTPQTAQVDSTHIAALINGDAVASTIITAVANVASSPIAVTTNGTYALGASASGQSQSLILLGSGNNQGVPYGDGMGVAFFDQVGAAGTGRLHLEAVIPGNDQNMISLAIVLGQGGNTVAVTGKAIVVNRTEAVGTGVTIANLVTAINGNTSAAALVTASGVGTTSDLVKQNLLKSYLNGGGGESPSATVAGVAATITAYSDTAITVKANVTGIVSAGYASGDGLLLQIQANYALISTTIPLNA